MAKKKLNKKVAIIGSAAFMIMAIGVIGVILKLSQKPEKFIKLADDAMVSFTDIKDKEEKESTFKEIKQNYLRANARTKSDSLKVEIYFKLADLFFAYDKWPNVRACWEEILQLEKKNAIARFGQLKYNYIAATSGIPQFWKRVSEKAADFIEIADEKLLAEDPNKFESFMVAKRASGKTMESYLYLLKGIANYRVAKMGVTTKPEELLDSAIEDLQRVIALEPENVQASNALAQAYIEKGRAFAAKNDLEQREQYRELAMQVYQQSVENAPQNPDAHINLLWLKLQLAAGMAVSSNEQIIEAFVPEYNAIVEKFPSQSKVYNALANFYSFFGHEFLDQAIENIEKAIELDAQKVAYRINAAKKYYKKASIYNQKTNFETAVEIAKNALKLPGAQEVTGPKHWENQMNQVALYSFLANYYIEQVIEARKLGTENEPDSLQWLKGAEQAVHQIEQIFGSGEEPRVVKWRGMLDLAKGDKKSAVKKLYSIYEKFKATGRRDVQLSYTLAMLYKNTKETGAATEFFASALMLGRRIRTGSIDESKPESLLDFAELLLRQKFYKPAITIVENFEKNYWSNDRSKKILIITNINASQFDQAEELLAQANPDDPNTMILNIYLLQEKMRKIQTDLAYKNLSKDTFKGRDDESQPSDSTQQDDWDSIEIKGYVQAVTDLIEKLLVADLSIISKDYILSLCQTYISQDNNKKANRLIDKYLAHFPDDTATLVMKQILAEPDPKNVLPERRTQIQQQILTEIKDPLKRAVSLGEFYLRIGEPNKAIEEHKIALEPYLSQSDETGTEEVPEVNAIRQIALSSLFTQALIRNDQQLAQKIVNLVRQQDLDGCEGNFFAARLAINKQEYKNALKRLDESLRQNPVFSGGYLLRSTVNFELGNESAAIEDAKKAAAINPSNPSIAKMLVQTLYKRSQKLGKNATPEQIIEVDNAMQNAIRLNRGDWQLLGIYAEYISTKKPSEALGLRQKLQKAVPNVQNALALGKMAMKMAQKQQDEKEKKALLDMAGTAFEQALTLRPDGKAVIQASARYYRTVGQKDKAEKLLIDTKSNTLLWRHYAATGQIKQAKELLDDLYDADPKDPTTLRGLISIAKKTRDVNDVKKYSQKLIALNDTAGNRLLQIEIFLQIGLTKDAELKLQSFKEKYPNSKNTLAFEAWAQLQKGFLDEALTLITRSLQNNPDNSVAWKLRGEINKRLANHTDSVNDLKQSRALNDLPETRLALAKAYIAAGKKESAISELKTITDDPQLAETSMLLLRDIYGRAGGGKIRDLKELYDVALEKFPDKPTWYIHTGMFAINTKNYKAASELFQKAMNKSQKGTKDNLFAFDGYLEALYLDNKLRAVVEAAKKEINSELAPLAYWKLAEVKMKLGDNETAVAYIKKAIDKGGDDEQFVTNILQNMQRTLGIKALKKLCLEKLQENPDSIPTNFAMSKVYKADGEYNKAIDCIDKSLQMIKIDDPRWESYKVEKAKLLHAAYNKTSDKNYLEMTIAEYESLLEKMPNNYSVLNNLAFVLAMNDTELEKALKYAERAYQLTPNSPGIVDTYAFVLYKNEMYKDASRYLQMALQLFELKRIPVSWDIYEHLGMIEEKLQNQLQAFDAYKQAIEILNTGPGSQNDKQRIQNAIERLAQ